jgi:hypothetical protein
MLGGIIDILFGPLLALVRFVNRKPLCDMLDEATDASRNAFDYETELYDTREMDYDEQIRQLQNRGFDDAVVEVTLERNRTRKWFEQHITARLRSRNQELTTLAFPYWRPELGFPASDGAAMAV